MSNQSYDESEIIQEIIEALKTGSKSPAQIRQDLHATDIPEYRVNAMLRAAMNETHSSEGIVIRPTIDENRELSDKETIIRYYGLGLVLMIMINLFQFCFLFGGYDVCSAGYMQKPRYKDSPNTIFTDFGLCISPILITLSVIRISDDYFHDKILSTDTKVMIVVFSSILIPVCVKLSLHYPLCVILANST